MAEQVCHECGAALGGVDGCVAAMNELLVRAQADAQDAGLYRLAFDCFCMQHPERHCVSAKSYAAHLMGLCHGLEHHAVPLSYWAIPKWLNTPRALVKPPVLPDRGRLTVADVRGTGSAEEHARRVRAWAENVWTAYASQDALAREWLRRALGEPR